MAVTFSESVSGVNASDLLINTVPATSVTGSGAGPYTFTFTQPSPGPVQLTWVAGHGIVDSTGNGFSGGSWSYVFDPNATGPQAAQSSYIGPVVLATRGVSTTMRFRNNLGDTSTSQLAAWVTSTDQSLHWADPLGTGMNMNMMNYSGPIPAVPHLHGGEVPPVLDGGPDAWFTR